MSRPSKWWWGLLPLAAVWICAIFFKTSVVEEDVRTRAGSAVAASGLEIRVAGRDVTLEGATLTAATRDAAEATRGVRLVHGGVPQSPGDVVEDTALATTDLAAETSSAATRRPSYDWSLRRDAGVIVLSGQVPSAAVRDRIAAAARNAFPGAEIRDETLVAAGAPAGVEEGAIYALGQAARLPDGRVSLSGGEYSIAGTAPTPAAYEAVRAAANDLPEGLTLASVDVLPPGETVRRGEDAAGEVSDRAARADSTERAEGVEAAEGAGRAEPAARSERAESAERADDADRVARTTATSEAGEQASPAATDTAGGPEPAEAGACRQRFTEVLGRSRFRFETGSSALSAEATGALDELAAVAGPCLGIQGDPIQLAIAGHTDSVGTEAFNLGLSRRRAQAAIDHLTREGTPAAKLTATGYGESRPVASNDTEDGRARNRRIEIHVQ